MRRIDLSDADLRGKWVQRGQAALVDSTSPRRAEKVTYYSAVCLETGEVASLALDGYSSTEASVVFLQQLRAQSTQPLVVFWANSPTHGGEALRAYLRTPDLRLHLVRLPAYSPDYNADEAIWDWAREEVTANTCLGTKLVAAVLRWLTSYEAWLLIYDNLEALDVVTAYVPPARQGALLFTSRKQALGMSGHALDLDKMTAEEGLLFLLHRARLCDPTAPLESLDPAEVATAREIVAAMDGLPLALDQAGAYIEATHCTLADYLSLWRVAPLRLLDERDPTADHPLSVAKTLTLAFEQVECSHPQAAEVLTACAFLAPEDIPEALFLQGATFLGPTFEVLAADPLEFQAAMKTLLAYSLIHRQATPRALTIHRLVQAVLKDRLPDAAQRGWAERVVQALSALFPEAQMQSHYYQSCERLLPHALACLALSEQWSTDGEVRVALMTHVAHYCFNRAQFAQAEQWYQRALLLAEHSLGVDHPLTAEALDGLASIYAEQGNYSKAKPFYQRALRMREDTLGPEALLVADSLHNLDSLSGKQGNYAEAEQLHRRALHIRERALGPDALLVALTLNNLAVIHFNQKRYREAEPLFQRALRIREQALGPEDPLVANPLTNLGQIYVALGRYPEAERFLRRALRSREGALGPEHPGLSHVLSSLADLCREQGNYPEAEMHLQRALCIIEQAFGLEHPMTAQLLFGLAELCTKQGNYIAAERLYQRVWEIQEPIFGKEHFMHTYPLNGLAELSRGKDAMSKQNSSCSVPGRFGNAWMARSIRIGQRTLSGHARLCAAQARYAEAEALYARTWHLREQLLGPDHPLTAETVHDLAEMSVVQGKRAESLPYAERALHRLVRRKGETVEAEQRQLYQHLLQTTEQTLHQAQLVQQALVACLRRRRAPVRDQTQAERLRRTVERFLPLVAQVIHQARTRVLEGGRVPAQDKVVSLFEPHTRILQRRKTGVPIEFGRHVVLDEVEGGIVTRYRILPAGEGEQPELEAAVAHQCTVFGHPPEVVAADRAFHAPQREARLQGAGVKHTVIPWKGQASAERRALEHSRAWKRRYRWRAGIEGRIHSLRRDFGLKRCRDHGEVGMERCVGWGILASNLWHIGQACAKRVHKAA